MDKHAYLVAMLRNEAIPDIYKCAPDAVRPVDICTSCGSKKNPEESFMLIWDDGAGMCETCVKSFRERSGYYRVARTEARIAREIRESGSQLKKPLVRKHKKSGPRPMRAPDGIKALLSNKRVY